jgi:hypothetical protein
MRKKNFVNLQIRVAPVDYRAKLHELAIEHDPTLSMSEMMEILIDRALEAQEEKQ